MGRRTAFRLGGLGLLMVVLACSIAWWLNLGETFLVSGIDALFGQIYLSRGSGPPSARNYVSNEILLDGGRPSGELEARLIALPAEAYFWGPAYAGFAQTALAGDELEGLLQAMRAGPAFLDSNSGEVLCIEWLEGSATPPAPCEAGNTWRELHDATRMGGSMEPEISVLQVRWPDGRLAEYRMYSADGVLAYSTEELNEPIVQGLMQAGSEVVVPLTARARIQPVSVLWPDDTAERANGCAVRRLGRRYRDAVEFVRRLETLRQVVGEVQEIRPAEGKGGNWSSTWMDSTSLQLLLRVKGDQGDGVVRLRGWDCWEAELLAEGRLVDLTSGFTCPGT